MCNLRLVPKEVESFALSGREFLNTVGKNLTVTSLNRREGELEYPVLNEVDALIKQVN